MGCIGNILFSILQFAAVVLVVVGAVLDLFRAVEVGKKGKEKYVGNNYCITLWGTRERCYILSYTTRSNDLWTNCGVRPQLFRMAQVCVVISMAVMVAAWIIGMLLNCFCCCLSWLCSVLNVVAVVTLCLTWASMLACYKLSMGYDGPAGATSNPCVRLKDYTGEDGTHVNGMGLGAGIIMLIVSWAVVVVDSFVLLLPI